MTTRMIAGKELEFDADGFLANYTEWTPDVAQELAQEIRIELTEDHWKVINFCRDDFVFDPVQF